MAEIVSCTCDHEQMKEDHDMLLDVHQRTIRIHDVSTYSEGQTILGTTIIGELILEPVVTSHMESHQV